MKDHTGCVRGFYQASRSKHNTMATLPKEVVDDVTFGFYHREGGTTGEMSMQWSKLNGKIVAKLVVFNDAWDALNRFHDVLDKMAFVDSSDITPDQFCNLLLSCDVIDMIQDPVSLISNLPNYNHNCSTDHNPYMLRSYLQGLEDNKKVIITPRKIDD